MKARRCPTSAAAPTPGGTPHPTSSRRPPRTWQEARPARKARLSAPHGSRHPSRGLSTSHGQVRQAASAPEGRVGSSLTRTAGLRARIRSQLRLAACRLRRWRGKVRQAASAGTGGDKPSAYEARHMRGAMHKCNVWCHNGRANAGPCTNGRAVGSATGPQGRPLWAPVSQGRRAVGCRHGSFRHERKALRCPARAGTGPGALRARTRWVRVPSAARSRPPW